MRFRVIERSESIPVGEVSTCYLRVDHWDDWAKYRTLFQLVAFDSSGVLHELGDVKIGCRGLQPSQVIAPGARAPLLERVFVELPEGYFSLGQSENYYETLGQMSSSERAAILSGLRDVAFDLELFESVQSEGVVHDSLLRSVSAAIVRTRFHRLSKGNATLTGYSFNYSFPPSHNILLSSPRVGFIVTPESVPPTNIHVVIGRNGVGKTRFMQGIACALLGYAEDEEGKPGGALAFDERNSWPGDEPNFAGLISVSFSAFDDFSLPEPKNPLAVHAVGLRTDDPKGQTKLTRNPEQLADDFCSSFSACRRGLRRDRWERAVFQLYNDPVFSDANPLALLDEAEDSWQTVAHHYFRKRLSSGHKIVLLSITKLVELVDERTLVLLDEPEGHLHPPLLAAFIRSISDLLVQRNGVAIVATHSPVILQEVPASCVWILERTSRSSVAARPTLETFGENVGRLTREVFGLEVTHSGFHSLIRQEAENVRTFEELAERFDGKLGAEGSAIARGVMLRKARSL